jgi:hypothetical protein
MGRIRVKFMAAGSGTEVGMKASGNTAASLMRDKMVGGKGGEGKNTGHVGMLRRRRSSPAAGSRKNVWLRGIPESFLTFKRRRIKMHDNAVTVTFQVGLLSSYQLDIPKVRGLIGA